MKNKYILSVVTILIFTLFACKKENSNNITGNWQEEKMRIYTIAPNGVIANDTTYSRSTFTNLDYVQFNNDGTCIIATDYTYHPVYWGTAKVSASTPATTNYSYRIINYKSAIVAYSLLPGAYYTTDTALFMNAKTLLIHSVYYPYNPYSAIAFPPQKTISDSYYSK